MLVSNLFTKTRRDVSGESKNYQYLVRAGYVDQVMAGVYTYLPLGLCVLKKIENIIREEMMEAGGQEIEMPALQPKENWEKTGRWETEDNLFKFTSFYTKTELALGPTHEEVIMPLMKKFILSYRDLPKYVFQIQTKFRDEKRAKAGLLRSREFLMKDLYSFHADEKDLDEYYEKMKGIYLKIFKRCGIGDKTYITFASGGSFSKFSHEFQTESLSGEDTVFLCEKCQVAINQEVIDIQKTCPECQSEKLKEIKAIEVGNIFKNKDKYTKPFGVSYLDKNGKDAFVLTGCYGIGLSRLLGAIVEVCNDERGIIWPKEVTPFQVHLINLGAAKPGLKLYESLKKQGISVLWDDRDESPGVKFTDADLVGLPIRLVISEKSKKSGGVELKYRNQKESEILKESEIIKKIKEFYAR